MPMYMKSGSPQQQLASYGRKAPQQGNAAGGNGAYSQQQPTGASSTRPVQGLATALSGQRPAQYPQQAPQQAPQQQANHAFGNWNEPGTQFSQPMQQGPTIMAGMNRPVAGQMAQPAAGAVLQKPIKGLPMAMSGQQAPAQGDAYGSDGAMMQRQDSLYPDTGNGLGVQGSGSTRDPTSRMAQRGSMNLGQFSGQQAGPPMMGPATGSMSLSGALQGGQQGTNRIGHPRNITGNPTVDAGIDAALPVWLRPATDGSNRTEGERLADNASNGSGSNGTGDGRGDLGVLGREAGKFASAFPSGFASGLNENELTNLNQYYNNFSDIQDEHDQGHNLMDPAQQAAADAAERQQMQTGINSQRDDALRMMMGQRGRGGMVGTGASTGILNSALRAQALGEQGLAQDQYQRMLGREQLGGQLESDYARQKYGIMNDNYTSGGDIAALLLGGGKSAAGAAGSGAQGLGSILAALGPLIAGGAAAV